MQNINEKLVEIREHNKINQSEMARILDVSRTALYRYETGERTPDVLFLVKFAEYFGISLDDLVFNEETPLADEMNAQTRDQLLLEKYHQADPVTQKNVDKLLDMPE